MSRHFEVIQVSSAPGARRRDYGTGGARIAQRGSRLALAVALLLSTATGPAGAFSIFIDPGAATVSQNLEQAARWTLESGNENGIQVGVDSSVSTALSTAPGEDLLIEQRITDAFHAWESPALNFDVSMNSTGTAEGNSVGFEIDLFAVGGTHPIFAGTGFFGFASFDASFTSDRTLSNGQSFEGYSITGVDLYLNIDNLAQLIPLGQTLRLDAMTRVLIHEIGHGLGLGHPNSNNPFGVLANFDTDFDPLNPMTIDPSDPFASLLESANRDDSAIMSNGPCGIPAELPCDGAFFTSLRLDDMGGRDALYPVPEPSTGLLLSCGLLLLAARSTAKRSAE